MKKLVLLILGLCITVLSFALTPDANGIVYVKPIACGSGDGSSWSNACSNIQNAINTLGVNQVWVLNGTYIGTFNVKIILKKDVSLYGGFAGTETSLEERVKSDLDKNGTIDSWEYTNATILTPNTTYDYKTIVEIALGSDSTTIIDGFTITNGKTTSTKTDSKGMAGYASGIINHGGKISNCVISNCISNSSTVSGIIYNTYGGGVFNDSNSVIIGCKIKGCKVSSVSNGYGGGAYNSKGTIMRNCLIDSCSASGYSSSSTYISCGGGVYNERMCKLLKCNIRRCNAKVGINCQGGGIFNSNQCENTNCTIKLCNAGNSSNYEISKGGGIYSLDSCTISSCIIDSCTTITSTLGYSYGGGTFSGKNCAFTGCNITNCKINSGNTSYSYGGGMYNDSSCVVNNSSIINCSIPIGEGCNSYGGGIYNTFGCKINKCNILNCTATYNSSAISSSSQGGGIYNRSYCEIDSCLIKKCRVSTYQSPSNGGGIYNLEFCIVSNSTIDSCSIYGNGVQGGGVYNKRKSKLIGSTVSNCNATACSTSTYSYCGGVYNDSSVVNNCLIYKCKSDFNPGMYCSNSTIKNTTISYCNTNIGSNGGVMGYVNCTLDSITVDYCSNTGHNSTGGGLCLSNSTLSNSTIKNCTSEEGGGIYVTGSSINNCIIKNCTATYSGGGIKAYDSKISNCHIYNCILKYTSSAHYYGPHGGGVDNRSGIMINCVINNCKLYTTTTSTSSQGGGVYSTGKIINCTVTNCLSETTGNYSTPLGGGVCLQDTTASLINSILWGNRTIKQGVVSDTTQVHTLSGSTYSNCALENQTGNGNNNVVLSISNDIDTNCPHFLYPTTFNGVALALVDTLQLDSADWKVSSLSPCINIGNKDIAIGIDMNGNSSDGNLVSTDIPSDIIGRPRVQNTNIDLGAYEYGSMIRIISTYSGDGIISPNDTVIDLGQNIEFTIKPVTNCKILSAIYNSNDIMGNIIDIGDSTYTFTKSNMVEDGRLHVTFSSIPTGLKDNAVHTVNIYPTMVQSAFIINLNNSDGVMKIYNSTGILMLNRKITTTKEEIDISNFTTGVYFVSIQSDDKYIVRKIVKK